jgi:hypothetical protein
LAKAAQELALEWWEDSTNAEVSYQRNALRHEILPKIVQRFPRALGALVEFGRAWSELSLPQQPDAAWSVSELSARVSLHQWKAWSPRHREAELLSLASGWTGGRLSRRSLEALVQEHPVERWTGRAGSLRLSVLRGMVTWELVAKVSSPQYFIRVNDGQGLELPFGRGTVRFVAEGTALPVIVRGEPVFLASGFSVVARSWWGRHPEIRAQVLPGGRSCAAFLVQGNKVRALWGPDGTLIWKESSRPHLNGGEIFVNLELRSAYER